MLLETKQRFRFDVKVDVLLGVDLGEFGLAQTRQAEVVIGYRGRSRLKKYSITFYY